MNLAEIPLLDHHCHALRRSGAPLDGVGFRRHFSESTIEEIAPHLKSSLFYRRGLRDLAALLGCEPTEEGVLHGRYSIPLEQYAHRCFEAANIEAILVDTGYRGAENYSLDEMRAFLPCRIEEVLRLESLAERLIVSTNDFDQLEEAFRENLREARSHGVVAFKSIVAYRGGLEVRPRTREEATVVYTELKEQALRTGSVRLTQRPLLEYLLRVGLEEAAAQDLPVQFHTGFGDDDADLRTANPLHLRPLLQDAALRNVPFVLLHTYPYTREAGYLASIYPNVYIDLSLTIPFTAYGGAEAICAALELAPTSKVLLATDAFSIPELFYLGALYARHSLAAALDRLLAQGWLEHDQAEEAARQMLHENAVNLYNLVRSPQK